MLKSILKNLNGHGSEAASLEAAILQLGRDREETRAKIESLQKQRHQALLDDASDADLDKLERQLDRAMVQLEKLNAAEPPLLEKLSAARTLVRQRLWRSHLENYHAAAVEFIASARATAQKHAALIGIVDQAQREGFAGEVAATMPTTPSVSSHPICAPDLLDLFEHAITPVVSSQARAPAKTDTTRQFLPNERKPTTNMQHAVSLNQLNATPRERAPRTPDDMTPLEPGQARVKVARAGYSPADDLPQCNFGQIVVMPAGAARRAAEMAAVEILEEAPFSTTDVRGAAWQSVKDVQSLTAAVASAEAREKLK